MLAKAGADIMMPVMVDGAVGTAVDSAYYSFNQVTSQETLACISHEHNPKELLRQLHQTRCILVTAVSSFSIIIIL